MTTPRYHPRQVSRTARITFPAERLRRLYALRLARTQLRQTLRALPPRDLAAGLRAELRELMREIRRLEIEMST